MQTDDLDDDFVLSDGPGYRAALCSKCGAIKPIKDFQRRMSKAYAQGMGKAAGVGMVVESSMCKACQPKPKPVHKLTRKELHNKVESGDVHAAIAAFTLSEREDKRRAKLRTAAQEQWETLRKANWDAIIEDVKLEMRRVQQQEKYAKKIAQTYETLTFFVEYKALLKATIGRLKLNQIAQLRKEDPLPPHEDWQGYVDPSEWQRLREHWFAVPFTYRNGVKPPELLNMHPADAAPFTPPTNRTLRKYPTAAERLGHNTQEN